MKTDSKILLHTCCAPCTTAIHEYLAEHDFKVTGLFYNPNIHPYKEYLRRLDTLRLYASMKDLAMVYLDEYRLEEFLKLILEREADRCMACYLMRLERVALYAQEHGFKRFTTTLLISPYQKHDWIIEASELLAKQYSLEFFYHDFRELFNRSKELSKELNLYRQPYCGCLLSERDRYLKRKPSLL